MARWPFLYGQVAIFVVTCVLLKCYLQQLGLELPKLGQPLPLFTENPRRPILGNRASSIVGFPVEGAVVAFSPGPTSRQSY